MVSQPPSCRDPLLLWCSWAPSELFSPLKLPFPNSTAISDGNASNHESKKCSHSWTHYLS